MLVARRRTAMEIALRVAFVRALTSIMGDVRLLWMPTTGEGLTVRDLSVYDRVITHSAVAAGRTSSLGRGGALTFNGTDQYATIPDSDTLSFGNGTTDSAFSAVALANVTATVTNRTLMSKWHGGITREYLLYVGGGGYYTFQICDQSAGVVPSLAAYVLPPTGVWHLFGMSYDGRGGATAIDGVTLYSNAVTLATANTNHLTNVAMEAGTVDVLIGTYNGGTAGFMDGSLALVALCAKALSAGDHAAIAALCRAYFGVAL